MTNEIVSNGPEANSMYACNSYASNGLNQSNQSMFYNAANQLKSNSSVLCQQNSHLDVPNDTQLNACSNGFINRILPNYYERVSKKAIFFNF